MKKTKIHENKIGEHSMEKVPAGLKYTREHEWAKITEDTAIIGITHHAQDSLGDIVFVEMPKLGSEIRIGEAFGVVESVKAVSDLFAPLSGVVTEVNEELQKHPEIINSDPYEKGWIIKIRPSHTQEINQLFDAKAYADLIEGSH